MVEARDFFTSLRHSSLPANFLSPVHRRLVDPSAWNSTEGWLADLSELRSPVCSAPPHNDTTRNIPFAPR
jgi:hypothetical protein